MVFVLSYLALLFGNFGSPCRDYREVKDFLKSIGMEDLYEKCVEEELTMDLIQILSDDNLKCIGVKTLGARMRFIQAASKWEWVQQVTNDIDELSQNSNHEEPGEPEVLGDQPEVVDNEPEVTEPQFYSDQLTTNKVSHSYVIGKYRFWRKLVTKSGLSYFYCDHQGCKAKITARYSSIENKNLEEPVLQAPLPGPSDHVLANGERHEPDKGKILKKMAFLKIKDEIRKDPLKPVKQIHETVSNEVMSNLHNDNEKLQFLQSMTNSEQASRREYRWRNAIIPPNPKTQRQIDVRNRFAQDHHGISLIVGDDQGLDDNDRLLAVSHPYLLKCLRQVTRAGIDATFKSAPGNYYQMLVFNGLIGEGTDNSLWVPFFYVFMPRKTRDMYNRAYKLMEEAVVNAGGILNENLVIMMDFETAMREEWRQRFPQMEIKGCFFHYCQALWRHVLVGGMSKLYMSDSLAGKIFQGIVWMAFSLPLVPLNRLNEAVELIKLEIVNIGDQRIENWCGEFCSYIEDYWMNGIHNRVEWNYYDVISDNHLTNNICEGMNNRLMHRIGLKKASIYRVFQTLQSELDTAKNKVDTFCAGSQVKPYYRHRQTNTDQTRRNLKSQLETGNLDLRKYMRAMGALHSKTSLSKKKKNRTIHVATQEELAVTVTDGADPTVQIPSLPLLQQSQTQQRGGGRGRRRGRGQSRGRGSGLGRGRGRGRGSRMEQERGFVSQISSTDTESDDNVIETDSIDNDFDVSINLENVLLDVIELEQSVIERQVERDQEVQLGARKKRGRVFLSSSSSGSSAHKPMRNQPRMQDHLTQGIESPTIQEEVFIPVGEPLVPRNIEDYTWMNHPVSPEISALARNVMSTPMSLVSSLPMDSYNAETYRSEESLLTNVVLQRFPTPVSTLSTRNATTPVTTPPISVMTPPAPPMTRRMAAKCQSKPTMKRKMTRLTARTNTEHCCNVCSTTFSTMEELQFHLEVFHLSINPSVVPPTGPQPCPHCGGKKFSNIVTHLSRFHSK